MLKYGWDTALGISTGEEEHEEQTDVEQPKRGKNKASQAIPVCDNPIMNDTIKRYSNVFKPLARYRY